MTILSTSQTVNIIANALGVNVDSSEQFASEKSVNGPVENLTTVRAAEQVQLSDSNISHTLIFKDRLEGGANIMTMGTVSDAALSEISNYHEQGKHTTTFSEIYELDNETSLIDTPGIRGFGLVKIDSKDIRRYFPEFAQNQHKCKYSNCVHINEPKCEIKKLISSGLIISSRYDNYCSMFRSEDIYR